MSQKAKVMEVQKYFSEKQRHMDEHFPPVLKKELQKNSWDDEDVDDDDVKESWEDEDETAPAPAPKPPAEKRTKKRGAKASENKGKNVVVVVAKEEPLDPVAEQLRQERLVEEADFKSTRDLFGGKADERDVYTFIPKSESDFIEYAELISHRLRPYEKSFHYNGLLRAVMRLSMTNLKAVDAKEVSSSVTAIANERTKAEKEANAGKKKTAAKKKQLHVDKADDEAVVEAYDALDDYEFM